MKKQIFAGIITIFLKVWLLHGQVEIPFQYNEMDFKEYINLVEANNLEYAAEKLNIKSSEAAIELARIFQDPYISFDWTEEKENRSRTGYGFSSEFGKTIEFAGKRNARIDLTLRV